MKKETKKMLNKLEILTASTATVIAVAAGHWVVGPAAFVGWGVWRWKRWKKQLTKEVKKARGTKEE